MNRSNAMKIAAFGALLLAWPALAEVVPTSNLHAVRPLAGVDQLVLAPVDRDEAAAADEAGRLQGEPERFAVPDAVAATPETHGTWEDLPDPRFQLWRLRIQAPGALSLNLGFDRFRLPKGARLVIHAPGGTALAREFTTRDNRPHGELWSPIILGDALVIELTLPAESRHDYELRLVQVGKGYRDFGDDRADKSGSCNNDVACPEGDPWRDEINSVGVYTLSGVWKCTGVMINNTAGDGTPYFLTANHCGISESNDQTMVVYWNFQSPTCGQQGGGSLADNQTGAIFRAAYGSSDFCLVELEELPFSDWNVTYSGWDRSSDDQASAVGIHHPSTDEKSISFEDDPTFTTSYYGTAVPGDGTHIRIVDWDDGTTEPGSSGSPLYSPDHHIVGQLHGGNAACGNDESDWYGRLSVSWNGGGSSATRLSDWLDPVGSAPLTLDLFDPFAAGMRVTPLSGLEAEGQPGGPFAPSSLTYLLENNRDHGIAFDVADNQPWIEVAPSGGMLPARGSATVTVSISAVAAGLPAGIYAGAVRFTNQSTHDGDTTRPVLLRVGTATPAYTWNLDSDPGWDRQGQWAFGQPTGGGGEQHGSADPTSGHTGVNVLGYNLAGDYAPDLPEYSLTTGAIDCGGLQMVSVRFRRWLNVEQPTYDHAYLRASNDGATWATVWENGGEIADSSWQLVEYDISGIADGQSTVYLRWVMGTTDDSWQYSGWNLDDIEILGLPATVTATPTTPAAVTVLHGAAPNPFNPRTEVSWTLARAGGVRLTVHDARGRLLQVLADGDRPAGLHTATWDGTDRSGRRLGSGVYFARLDADGTSTTTKLVLVK